MGCKGEEKKGTWTGMLMSKEEQEWAGMCLSRDSEFGFEDVKFNVPLGHFGGIVC